MTSFSEKNDRDVIYSNDVIWISESNMADYSDSDESDQFSDLESEDDVEIDNDSDETDEDIYEAPVNGPWFRVMPPEVEDRPQRFTENAGPKNAPPADAKPLAYFFLFFTIDFLRQIVTETNRYISPFFS